MKILYYNPEVVDCTADPHIVNYKDQREMLEDVIKVLESDLVHAVATIYVHNGNDVLFVSDEYSDSNWSGDRKLATDEFAKKHKVDGLYFVSDMEKSYPKTKKIPIGLTGAKRLLELFDENKLEEADSITIDVMWEFSRSINCSDEIQINLEEMTVNYQNQDWDTEKEGYEEHLQKLRKLLSRIVY